MQILDQAAVSSALSWPVAVAALRAALLGGLDPEVEPPRTLNAFGTGQLLTMASTGAHLAGVKLVTIAPDNPALGLPRISAVYTLFGATTLLPVAVLDGTALTSLRTPAVSALGVDLLAPPDAHRLLVFGTGPQAYGHVQALGAVRPVRSVVVVGRDAGRTSGFVAQLLAEGLEASVGTAADVGGADLVACCTTARTPVFDGRELPDTAVVVACGSHEPDAREVDSETVRRCGVAVESLAVAWAEAGDVIIAGADGAVGAADPVTLAALVRGETDVRPRLIKTVGMGWQDLVVAEAVLSAFGTAS